MSGSNNSSFKIKKTTVTLNAPPGIPNYEFLQQRVNTKMTFCGDFEQLVNGRAIMAQGHLTLLPDENMRQGIEAFLHKNVCVQGFLTPLGEGFQMVISEPGQIWLTGF